MIKYSPEQVAISEITIIKLKSPRMIDRKKYLNNCPLPLKCLKLNDSFSMWLQTQRTNSYIK